MSEPKVSLEMSLFNLYTLDIEQQQKGIQYFRDLFADKLLEELGPIFKKRLLGMTVKVFPIKAARKFEELLLQYELLSYQFILIVERGSEFGLTFWNQAKSFHETVFNSLEKRLRSIWDSYKRPEYYDLYCKEPLESYRKNLNAYIEKSESDVIQKCKDYQ